MEEFAREIMNQFGYFGVFFLILIENLFPPIPSEVILTLGGFMTTFSDLTVVGVIIASTIGSVLGAFILYFVGRILDVSKLEKLFESKLGRLLRLEKSDLKKAEKWFEKRGKGTVFFCRFIPIVRSVISIPAGMSHMNFAVFAGFTAVGTLIWNTVLVILGKVAGDAWDVIAGYFDTYSSIALFVFLAIAAAIILVYIKNRFFNSKEETGNK